MTPLRLFSILLLSGAACATPAAFAQTKNAAQTPAPTRDDKIAESKIGGIKIDGIWTGSLHLGAVSLRLAFKIATTGDGLSAQMQSPDQSPSWIPVSAAHLEAGKLRMEVQSLSVVFEGAVAPDGQSVNGTFTQRGQPIPLELKRAADGTVTELRRPQNPSHPYPYREEEVSYPSKAQGVTLAATLTLPEGKGPFPAVLLIAGSGPHDRDETLMAHKPFLVLADALTRKGIAVLRADKRGVAKSTGSYDTATTEDFADDAEAGLAFLGKRAEIDPKHIGLIGHSEGGLIAPIVAARNHNVAFIIMMAGPGVAGDRIIVAQSELLAKASGAPSAAIETATNTQRQIFNLLKQEKDPATLDQKLHALLATSGATPESKTQIELLESPWMRSFVALDPAVALKKLTCPVLVLNGEKDLQVPPALNLPAIRSALNQAGNQHYEIDELPGLNHLFQTAKTGLPIEYAQIDETISPVVLDKIAAWILHQ